MTVIFNEIAESVFTNVFHTKFILITMFLDYYVHTAKIELEVPSQIKL